VIERGLHVDPVVATKARCDPSGTDGVRGDHDDAADRHRVSEERSLLEQRHDRTYAAWIAQVVA
jgi:hypothetical protein